MIHKTFNLKFICIYIKFVFMSDQITNEPPEVWRCLICAWENSVEPLPEGGGACS